MHSKKLINKKAGSFSDACHIPTQKAKKQGEMPLPILIPISSLNSTFLNGMGQKIDGQWHFPLFLCLISSSFLLL